jgi:hypothetical protein
MFTGSRKYQRKARKIQKLIGKEVLKGAPYNEIEWEYDASDRNIKGAYADPVTGWVLAGGAYLNEKGDIEQYDALVKVDSDSNGSLDAGLYFMIDVEKIKGFKKHIKAANKSRYAAIITSLSEQAYSDNGVGLADFYDSLPGVRNPYSSYSTGVGLTVNNNQLPMVWS